MLSGSLHYICHIWGRWPALLTLLVPLPLFSCSQHQSTTLLPFPPDHVVNDESAEGIFTLTPALPATTAGLLRIDVRSPDPLPTQIQVQEAAFVKLSIPVAPGWTSYIPEFPSLLLSLPEIQSIPLPGVTSAEIRGVFLSDQESGSSLIFENNPSAVTFNDFILVFALTQLPSAARTPQNIALIANSVFPTGNFTASGLNPLPTEINTNFVVGPQPPAVGPDFLDAIIVFAATQLPTAARTAQNLVLVANSVFPSGNLSPEDILQIPGSAPDPNTVNLKSAIPNLTFAGDVRIDILQSNFPTQTFNLPAPNITGGSVPFIQGQSAGSGITSYFVSASPPNFTNILADLSNLTTFTINGINDTCVQMVGLSENTVIAEATVCP